MSTATKTQTPLETNAFSALGEALETAAERFEEGSSQARESAKKAAGTVKRAFGVGVYNTAYWVSYGAVFSSVFLTELLPENSTLRRGLEEGADAALEAHGKLVEVEAEEVEETPAAKKTSAKPKKTAARKAK